MRRLHIETAAANAVIEGRKQFVNAINEFSAELKIEGITLTNEMLAGVIIGGIEYLSNLFVQSAVNEHNRAGIQVNSALLFILQQNATAVASDQRFTKYILPLQQGPLKAGIRPDQVILSDGKTTFTKAGEKEIIEAHTSYLKKKDEMLYERLDSFVQAINELGMYMERKVDIPLGECLRKAYRENSFVIDSNQKLQLRYDIPLIVDSDGSLVVNPSFFGAR